MIDAILHEKGSRGFFSAKAAFLLFH